MNRAVFVDFDGTLVKTIGDRGPRSKAELEILPGTKEAIRRLIDSRYRPIVVSNQPDIARGKINIVTYRLMVNYVINTLNLWSFAICRHDGNWCACRKPKPGLIWKEAVEFELDLSRSWMVGDRMSDIEAGAAAGCGIYRVETNQGITEAVEWILANSK